VTPTLAMAEELGEVERLSAWLVRQTGVRLDTLKRHYERWWPRDREAIRATCALLDPAVKGQIATRDGSQFAQRRDYTAKRKWRCLRLADGVLEVDAELPQPIWR
jgi:hypothetical protein